MRPLPPVRRIAPAALAAVVLAGCGTDPAGPEVLGALDPAASATQSADRCVNIAEQGLATLGGPIVLPNGVVGIGGNWGPITVGQYAGEIASVLTGERTTGRNGQGALHWTLMHAVRVPDGVGGYLGYFITSDRAVCAPAGSDPTTCRVNDVLTIVEGTGVFANAGGQLRNHGTIDFVQGTLGLDLRGRVCGDGL